MAVPHPATRQPLPLLPRAAAAGPELVAAVRRFHFLPEGLEAPAPGELLPALLAPYRGAVVRSGFPLFLPPDGAGADALPLPFPELLERLAPGGGERPMADHLRRLEGRVREALAGAGDPADARATLAGAADAVVAEPSLAGDAAESLRAALAALADDLPAGSYLVPWGPDAPLHLLAWAARGRCRTAREAFLAEARKLVDSLAVMAGSDGAEVGDAARRLGGSLGPLGGRYLDSSRLAGDLAAGHRGAELPAERRQRLEAALAALAGFLAEREQPDPALVVAAGAAPVAGWETFAAEEPCAAAAELFDAAADGLATVLRAARVARLELAGAYDPERHGPALSRFDWQSFSPQELALLRPLAVRVPLGHVAGAGLAGLSRLLLSGRPLQVLVDGVPGDPGSDGAGAFRFQAASFGLGHRVAFLQQGSPARPVDLVEGFAAALASTRSGLHVVATLPAEGREGGSGAAAALDPWLVAGAAVEGRAQPLVRFDPEAGEGWARRLDVARNPAAESDWPVSELVARREGGGEERLRAAFTFADYALLEAAWAPHFRLLPPESEHEDLVTVEAWLALGPDEALAAVPTVWALAADGRLVRLAVSRALALETRDRLDFWRTLQEMAGVKSEVARRAADEARGEAALAAAAELEALQASHEAELERVRRRALEEAVDRLTGSLLGLDPAAFTSPRGLSLQGGVEEVTATLLAALDGDEPAAVPGPAGAEVERVAAELLALVQSAAVPEEEVTP